MRWLIRLRVCLQCGRGAACFSSLGARPTPSCGKAWDWAHRGRASPSPAGSTRRSRRSVLMGEGVLQRFARAHHQSSHAPRRRSEEPKSKLSAKPESARIEAPQCPESARFRTMPCRRRRGRRPLKGRRWPGLRQKQQVCRQSLHESAHV